jgi:exonuclease III
LNPYSNVTIDSKFYTFDTLCNSPMLTESPLFLSINIQSLNSKHAELCFTIEELQKKNIKIDVVAIQETWEIRYPELVNIPGFQTFVFKNRANMRGGGVGFYVRNGLNFSILDDLSPFEDKIFESLTIKLTNHCNKSVLLTCGYRSNGTIPNVTIMQQYTRFSVLFEELLANLNRKMLDSYIMMDSNIDLLKLDSNVPSVLLVLLCSTCQREKV